MLEVGKLLKIETKRYEKLKREIRTWWDDRLRIGAILKEIQESKMYKHEYSTFEDFCESEFDMKRMAAYRLIEAIKVKESLPAELSENITNERQARALSEVEEEDREEVLETAVAKTNGHVTAKAIEEASEEIKQKKEPKEKEPNRDKTGYIIPDEILDDWRAAESLSFLARQIQEVKLFVENAIRERDIRFREVSSETVAELKHLWDTINLTQPYAVCPTCQGHTRDKCSVCKQRGYVSKFAYTHWFASEIIDIRERSIKR